MYKILRWFCGGILFVWAACTRVPAEEDVVVTAAPEFRIDLFEQRKADDGSPVFGLWVESLRRYECAGVSLESSVEVSEGAIRARLLGIRKPIPCAGDSATARDFLPIGSLADGVYAFTLSLGADNLIESKGMLRVAAGHWELGVLESQGVVFQNIVLERIPDGTAWGWVEKPNPNAGPAAAQFVEDLKTLTAPAALTPGYYGYFTVSGAGVIAFHPNFRPSVEAEFFTRHLGGQASEVRGLVEDYRNGQQALQVRCWTTLGAF
jgi:hypothetical protein